jgi:RNA polymerase sigma factor (sigma-70 family)
MAEMSDMELMREYADRGSEAAFAELVHRHINLVHSVALRYAGNDDDAQDVTQAVFIILARKAASLRQRATLTGWLYEATRFTGARLLRTRVRQQAREQEAYMQSTLNDAETDGLWRQLAPLLEEAMTRLSEKERMLLALRFFENKSGAEAAALLGIQEWAAHKRAARALEKLRKFFTQRGLVSTPALIARGMSANAVQAAPAALAKTATAAAVAKGATVGGSTLSLVKGASNLIAWTKAKTAIVASGVFLLGTVATIMTVQAVHAARAAAAPDIQGAWECVLDIGGVGVAKGETGKSRAVLRISKTNGAYHATADAIDLGRKDIPVRKVVYEYPSLRLEGDQWRTPPGKVNVEATEIAFKEGDSSAVLKRTATPDQVQERLADSDFIPRTNSDLQGYWKGSTDAGPDAVPLDFKIAEPADGTFHAEMDSPMQGACGQPLSVTYDRPAVKILVMAGYGMFQGEVNEADTEMTGTWTQGGRSTPSVFRRADYQSEQAQEAQRDYSHVSKAELQGHWQGILDVKAAKVPMTLDIAKLPDGLFFAQGATPEQIGREFPIPATTVEYAAPNLRLEWKWTGVVYEGKLKNGKLAGTWRSGDRHFPLVFERAAAQ